MCVTSDKVTLAASVPFGGKLTALVLDLFEPSMTAIHPLSAKIVAAASVDIKRAATRGQ